VVSYHWQFEPGMLLISHYSVGAFLAGFSKNMGMLIGGRFLTGLGCGTANNAS
jgi:MFS family permease